MSRVSGNKPQRQPGKRPGVDGIVYKLPIYDGNLVPILNKAEIESVLNSDLLTEHHIFELADTAGHVFLIIWNGMEYFYGNLKKAT